MRSDVPFNLRLDGMVDYVFDKGKWMPIPGPRLHALFAYSAFRGGRLTKVGPPVTGIKPAALLSLERKRRGRPSRAAKKCVHSRDGMCPSCVSKSHGIIGVSAAKSKGELVRRRVDSLSARIACLVGWVVSRGRRTDDEHVGDATRLKTIAIESEDAVTLALSLPNDPASRDSIAVLTHGSFALGHFRELSQAVYSIKHMFTRQKFGEFIHDGVATTRYGTILNLPKGASAASGVDSHRLALTFAPLEDSATDPEDPILIALPAAVEAIKMLGDPAVRRRLYVSFVHNGTGDPGVSRPLESFAPATLDTPERVTIVLGDTPLAWSHLVVILRVYNTVIIEASYFRPSEVALFFVAGLLLRTDPDHVCVSGMPIVHSKFKGTPREPHATQMFMKHASTHKTFQAVREGRAMPSIVVADDGTKNLTRVNRVTPLLLKTVAALEPEAPQGQLLQPEPEASVHNSE